MRGHFRAYSASFAGAAFLSRPCERGPLAASGSDEDDSACPRGDSTRTRMVRERGAGPALSDGQAGGGTGTTVKPSMPAKSVALQVYTGRPLASAVAAIMAS